MNFDRDEKYLAIGVTGPIGEEGASGQLLTTPPLAKGIVAGENSLWEGLLLNFAIERDPRLARLLRKEARLRGFALGSVATLNGFGAGQSIPFLVASNGTLFARQVLGVITSGLAFTGLGIQIWLSKKYRREEKQELARVKQEIRNIVNRLRMGDNPELVRLELDELVGAQAGKEFISLWLTVHPRSRLLPGEESPNLPKMEELPPDFPQDGEK